MAALREDGSAPPAGAGDGYGLAEPAYPGDPEPTGEPASLRSLVEDLEALIDDGQTYLSAELSYQKTRVSFVSDRLKKTIALAIGAAVVGLLAAIGLTVGLIIALTPLLTGWGATAVVVLSLLLVAFLLVQRAGSTWSSAMQVARSRGDASEDSGLEDEG